MSRWKAAGIHLALCLLVAAVIAAVLFGLWYPPPYFRAAGAGRLLLVLVGIDLVLGPLLTLIVFRSGKPSLKFDLATIATLQLLALGYGLHVMIASRPVYLVAAIDRFVLVSANQLDPIDLVKASRYRQLSWAGPRLVATQLPAEAAARNALLSDALAGKDIELQPRYYVEYDAAAPQLLRAARNLSSLTASRPQAQAELTRRLEPKGLDPKDVVWLPLVARNADIVMLLDRRNGQPIGAVPLSPSW